MKQIIIISYYEGTPQLQKIELKRQKNNYSISQAIMDYNLKKGRIRISERNNNSNYIVLIIRIQK